MFFNALFIIAGVILLAVTKYKTNLEISNRMIVKDKSRIVNSFVHLYC